MRAVVVDGKARFFERLQIATNRTCGDGAEAGKFVDSHARQSTAFNLAKDRPLADDFSVAWHRIILTTAIGELIAWSMTAYFFMR